MISSNWYELTRASRVTASSIISIEIIIRIMFFRLRIKPRIPIRNRTSDRVIIVRNFPNGKGIM
jgi:hypothetical protein